MNKGFKYTFLLSILLVILSLAGCGSTDESKQDTNKETKTVEVTAKADNKTEQTPKQQTAEEPSKNTSASTEKTAEEPAEKKTVSEESPAAPKESVASTTKTTDSQTTTNNNKTTTSATKPAATPSSKTTSTPAKTTTNTTSNKTTNTTQKTTTSTAANTTATAPKPAAPAPKPVSTATLSIVGPEGTILSSYKVKINTGYTIFDVVKQGAKEKGIVVDSTGSGATAYIEGIDNIYEFDYGAKSGWVFKLNGVSINKSVGAIKVKAGDRIECYYTK
ncbi:DUF4430 domain-containing protein [Bacillus sp. USDA818B3_A]|uniref:DUF4430 domain-containing protein n=1 Tax=Bacillus sp. USDA818B3_A TaxID=2698834 RepID=UPI00136FAD27|nr:DUF4430 domain-containing protein [Bacillus sp. USDA818B3_A]